MKIGIFSDVHADMEGLRSLLKSIELNKIDRLISLGDNIGYGYEPEEVISYIRNNDIPSVLGNHELAIFDEECREGFNPKAYEAIIRTKNAISLESLQYIKELPLYRIVNDALFVHGCPPDSPITYMNHLTFDDLENIFESNRYKLSFTGHTHKLFIFTYNGTTVGFENLNNKIITLRDDMKYIVNVGSVSYSRDKDRKTRYVIWDDEKNTLEIVTLSSPAYKVRKI